VDKLSEYKHIGEIIPEAMRAIRLRYFIKTLDGRAWRGTETSKLALRWTCLKKLGGNL
jgi:hypothetical protein